MKREDRKRLLSLLQTSRELMPYGMIAEAFKETGLTPKDVVEWLRKYYIQGRISEEFICLVNLLKDKYFIDYVRLDLQEEPLVIVKSVGEIRLTFSFSKERYITPADIAARIYKASPVERKEIINLLYLWLKDVYKKVGKKK